MAYLLSVKRRCFLYLRRSSRFWVGSAPLFSKTFREVGGFAWLIVQPRQEGCRAAARDVGATKAWQLNITSVPNPAIGAAFRGLDRRRADQLRTLTAPKNQKSLFSPVEAHPFSRANLPRPCSPGYSPSCRDSPRSSSAQPPCFHCIPRRPAWLAERRPLDVVTAACGDTTKWWALLSCCDCIQHAIISKRRGPLCSTARSGTGCKKLRSLPDLDVHGHTFSTEGTHGCLPGA